ncbi:unnamed protein product, partial [Cyprideis torosa]
MIRPIIALPLTIAGVFFGIVLLILFYFISIYNKLVRLKTLVGESWSGIDVQLKKRYDLIPNLVETVKGYASHEKETFESVTMARVAAQSANGVKEQEQAEKNLNQALVNLMAVAERYPELKANTNFMQLQHQLTEIEEDIEKSRRYYNGTVREQNILIDSFPSNIVANMFNFTKSSFFELENTAERQAPKEHYEELITNYEVDIEVLKSGKIRVTEDIEVNALGMEIQRGIVRELPLYRKDEHHSAIKVEYDILSVEHNGAESNYLENREGKYLVIKIGSPDVFIEDGLHQYRIVYEVDKQIGSFEAYDEIYWNAIDTDCQALVEDSLVLFQTSRALEEDEGLTVA